MRIAIAMINCNRRDGAARAVSEVSERLARRGHEVTFFARTVEDIDLTHIRWHRIPGPGRPEIADYWTYYVQANRALRNHDYDIVHSIGVNTAHANVVTIQNIQPAKMKVLKLHSPEQSISLPRRFTRWLYLQVTSATEKQIYTARPGHPSPLFLPVSQGAERELREYYDIGDAETRIIPNAADTNIFHPISAAERSAWRAANDLRDEDIVCIFSGGEWARKGLDLAIRAMAKLPAALPVKLFVAGDDIDRERFKTMIAELGIVDRVVLGGFRRDVATALASSDIFLFPSHYEAFSLATIEAAACGLPVIAARINGTEEFIQPGVTGDFVKHDPEDIARVLEPLITNANLRQNMGEKAQTLVKEQYNWDRVADLTEQAYQSVIAKKKA